jgi:hypothetical protein
METQNVITGKLLSFLKNGNNIPLHHRPLADDTKKLPEHECFRRSLQEMAFPISL